MARSTAHPRSALSLDAAPLDLAIPAFPASWARRLGDGACLLGAIALAGALAGAVTGSALLAGSPRLEAPPLDATAVIPALQSSGQTSP